MSTTPNPHDTTPNPRQGLISEPGAHARGVLIAAAWAWTLAMLAPVVLIAGGHNSGRAAWDSIVYHEVFIRQLATDWPRFDLSDPLTATTPGYHILLGTLDALGLHQTPALRVVSALIGATLSVLLACWVARRRGALDAVLLTLPLAASIYIIGSSAWLLPDNLAWIGVTLVLMLCTREPASWRPIVAATGVAAALVFTRQIHLWSAAPIWLAAWMGVRGTEPSLFDRVPTRLARAGTALALTLPAFLIAAWFIHLWHGPTPPRFQSNITGFNTATPAFILVQIPILMIGFGPWLLPAVLRAARDRLPVLLLAVGIAVTLVIIPPTTLNPEAGRFSGWWMLAGKAPVLANHTSTAFLVLAPLGAVLLAGALLGVPRRMAWVLLSALVAFAAAQSSTINSWQRYHEPFLLILLAMLAAAQAPDLRDAALAKLRIPGMLALCALLTAVTLGGLRGDPVAPGTLPPTMHTQPDDPWFQDHTMPPTPG